MRNKYLICNKLGTLPPESDRGGHVTHQAINLSMWYPSPEMKKEFSFIWGGLNPSCRNDKTERSIGYMYVLTWHQDRTQTRLWQTHLDDEGQESTRHVSDTRSCPWWLLQKDLTSERQNIADVRLCKVKWLAENRKREICSWSKGNRRKKFPLNEKKNIWSARKDWVWMDWILAVADQQNSSFPAVSKWNWNCVVFGHWGNHELW